MTSLLILNFMLISFIDASSLMVWERRVSAYFPYSIHRFRCLVYFYHSPSSKAKNPNFLSLKLAWRSLKVIVEGFFFGGCCARVASWPCIFICWSVAFANSTLHSWYSSTLSYSFLTSRCQETQFQLLSPVDWIWNDERFLDCVRGHHHVHGNPCLFIHAFLPSNIPWLWARYHLTSLP